MLIQRLFYLKSSQELVISLRRFWGIWSAHKRLDQNWNWRTL